MLSVVKLGAHEARNNLPVYPLAYSVEPKLAANGGDPAHYSNFANMKNEAVRWLPWHAKLL